MINYRHVEYCQPRQLTAPTSTTFVHKVLFCLVSCTIYLSIVLLFDQIVTDLVINRVHYPSTNHSLSPGQVDQLLPPIGQPLHEEHEIECRDRVLAHRLHQQCPGSPSSPPTSPSSKPGSSASSCVLPLSLHNPHLTTLQLVLGLVTIGPWALFLLYDILLYTTRAAAYEIPYFGGRARGRRRPQRPTLTERPDGRKRALSINGTSGSSGTDEKEGVRKRNKEDDSDGAEDLTEEG